MRKTRAGRPSPALVIAILALFVALGGTAAALSKNSVGTKQLKAGAVSTAKLKNGAVTNPKLGNGAVNAAKLGSGAVTTAKLGTGAVTAAKLGSDTRAYAYVDADGTLIAAQSSGVTGISHTPASGNYCLQLAFQPDVGVASTRGDESSTDEYAQVEIPAGGGCPAGTEAEVYTVDVDPVGLSDAGFSAIFN